MTTSTETAISNDILSTVFESCRSYAAPLIGAQETDHVLSLSHRKILPYFQNLASFSFDVEGLKINKEQLSDHELLAFAVWIQQFVREFKSMMVGVHDLTIHKLTADIEQQLNAIGFYEFYEQAKQLEY